MKKRYEIGQVNLKENALRIEQFSPSDRAKFFSKGYVRMADQFLVKAGDILWNPLEKVKRGPAKFCIIKRGLKGKPIGREGDPPPYCGIQRLDVPAIEIGLERLDDASGFLFGDRESDLRYLASLRPLHEWCARLPWKWKVSKGRTTLAYTFTGCWEAGFEIKEKEGKIEFVFSITNLSSIVWRNASLLFHTLASHRFFDWRSATVQCDGREIKLVELEAEHNFIPIKGKNIATYIRSKSGISKKRIDNGSFSVKGQGITYKLDVEPIAGVFRNQKGYKCVDPLIDIGNLAPGKTAFARGRIEIAED